MSGDFGVNQALVEELFIKWIDNPNSVANEWKDFFEGLSPAEWPQLTSAGNLPAPSLENGGSTNGGNGHRYVGNLPPTAEGIPYINLSKTSTDALELQGRVSAMVNAYRVRGHLFAKLDPLGLQPALPRELFLDQFGLDDVDPNLRFSPGDLAAPASMTLAEIVERLRETYTRSIGVEFTFLEDPEARRWIQRTMESTCNHVELTADEQVRILTKLTDAEIFEQFLHTKFKGAKRFSLEGGESFIPMCDYLIERASALGVEEIVIGMAHRGRLNILANIMDMPVHRIFAGFRDDAPERHLGGGDVKYHLGYSTDRTTACGNDVHLTLAFNPSHLEFVNPVVEGRVRAKQDRRGDESRGKVLPLLVHGDAAFAGQGIVPETLNLSELDAYRTGGTIHIVINNQIGFTTMPSDSRSTRYCTDITRMLRCPVFHVNGEDPEAVAQVVRLATSYRQIYQKDVVIDLFCYRKYGHNEGDEPRFTQPLTYAAVDRKQTVREIYVDHLVQTGKTSLEAAEEISKRRQAELETALEEASTGAYAVKPNSMLGLWQHYRGGRDEETPEADTGVARETLEDLLDKLTTTPEGFRPHRTIGRTVIKKQQKIRETGENVDWGTAENLALASLLADGTRIRLTGQDVRRGTFSHRHAVIYDHVTGRRHCRLAHLSPEQAGLEIYDSPLSEAGVLGFDWGYSLDSPDALVMWEAQFGDFANGAQVIIDQFLSAAEDKWHRLSGLTLLLPHGFEGQGPEHSSARLERFLMLCAEDNMQVCNLTTPAQIFHCLRRQVVRPWRKPLIIMTPKSLLRHPKATNSLDDLVNGSFQRIIDDPVEDKASIERVLLCAGKVYYDLVAEREARGATNTAIIRIEQLYPLRDEQLNEVITPYGKDLDLVWVQEEPRNMGAWTFVKTRWSDPLCNYGNLRCVSRPESASPATGSKKAHDLEQRILLDAVFAD